MCVKFTYWWVCVFSLFLWAPAVGTRRAKLGSREDTQRGEQVLVLSSLYTPARTEGYINEEIKGELVMLALPRMTYSWKATPFGWFLEQEAVVQFQKIFRTRTEKQKLLNYENNEQGSMRSDSVTRAWYNLRCHFPIPYLPVPSESESLNALMWLSAVSVSCNLCRLSKIQRNSVITL